MWAGLLHQGCLLSQLLIAVGEPALVAELAAAFRVVVAEGRLVHVHRVAQVFLVVREFAPIFQLAKALGHSMTPFR